MALLDFEGFDHGGFGIAGSTGTCSVAAQGRNSGYCAKATGAYAGITFAATTAAVTDSFIVGFAWKCDATSSIAGMWHLSQDGGSNVVVFDLDSGGGITYEVGTTDQQSLPGGTLVAGQWYYIEIEWLSHATTGVMKLRIDGAIPTGWTDVTSGDTYSSGTIETTHSLKMYTNIGGSDVYVDDVYMLDSSGASNNAFLGSARVPYSPVASQTSALFTGSDANSVDNHLLLDEVPVSMTDYAQSGTVTDRDVFGLTALGLTGTPLGVKPQLYAVDADGGSQAIDLDLVSGVVAATSSLVCPAADGFLFGTISDTNPDGGGALTTSIVDALELAYEVA